MQDEQGQPMTIGQLVNIANAKEADAEKARGNRTYYDANGRPYKITDNGREYVK